MLVNMLERDKVIAMSVEEAEAWIHEVPVDSPEFIRRHNVVYSDCGLTRAGFDINRPIRSGGINMQSISMESNRFSKRAEWEYPSLTKEQIREVEEWREGWERKILCGNNYNKMEKQEIINAISVLSAAVDSLNRLGSIDAANTVTVKILELVNQL
jgi:hypothetical protein